MIVAECGSTRLGNASIVVVFDQYGFRYLEHLSWGSVDQSFMAKDGDAMSTLIANVFLTAVFLSQSSIATNGTQEHDFLPTRSVAVFGNAQDSRQREVIYFDAPPRPYDAVIRR